MMKLGHAEIAERWRKLGRRWAGGLIQGLGMGLMIGVGIGIAIHDHAWTYILDDSFWASLFVVLSLTLTSFGAIITGETEFKRKRAQWIATLCIGLITLCTLGGVLIYGARKGAEVPLAYACSTGDLTHVALILESEPDLLKTHPYGRTLLEIAAANGRLNIVKYLVDQGAMVHEVNLNWKTAEDVARANHQNVTADYLSQCK